MAINFFSSKDSEDIRTMHSKSDNIEILIGNETNENIKERFESLLQRYQKGLEEKMSGSEFAFGNVYLLYHKLHKISLNRGGSYIDSPKWLENKKATTNPKNNDDKCFQYALTVALNHEQIKEDPQRITKFELFIKQDNWKDIGMSLKKKTIALNILYVPHGRKILYAPHGEKWHYLAIHTVQKKNMIIAM